MLYRLLFLFCFPILCLRGDLNDHVGPIPAWVKPYEFSLDVPLKPTQEHVQMLLEDNQKNWEEKTTYVHFVRKIVDQIGVERSSQIRCYFDPMFQTVIIHQIRLFRDGQWYDRLNTSHHSLIQREEGLDDNLFSGELTHLYVINDVRPGDIIDFSCSYVGENPVFSSHFSEIFFLESTLVLEKFYHRILMHPDQSFEVKYFNTSQEPIVTDLSPTLREYVWERTETKPACDDDDQPAWFDSEAHIQISQYSCWKELIDKLLPLYVIPSDFTENPSSEMVDLVKNWTDSTDDVAKRAALALRFVQDEVRYMGYEGGVGGYKPRDPRDILKRRYGDCKDKSVLLRTLLHLMNIPAHPVLVHASKGKRLSELLPTPGAFNHVVLQILVDGSPYYVDPTMSFQGGDLQTNHFPSYSWGLVIAEQSISLTALPEAPARILTLVDTAINVTSPTSAEVSTLTTCYGLDADIHRSVVKGLGPKKLKDHLLEAAQENYKGASRLSDPIVTDDREKNILTIQESYKIPTRGRMGKKLLKVYSSIIEDELDNNINLERSSPYSLNYPEWIKEHIHINNPFNTWATDSEAITHENESIRYTFAMKKEGQTADFDIELRHLKNHVPLNVVEDYWNIMHEINPNPSLELIIAMP